MNNIIVNYCMLLDVKKKRKKKKSHKIVIECVFLVFSDSSGCIYYINGALLLASLVMARFWMSN